MTDAEISTLIDAIETFVRAKIIDNRRDTTVYWMDQMKRYWESHQGSQNELDAARDNLANVLASLSDE